MSITPAPETPHVKEAAEDAAISPPRLMHWCHGFNCGGVPWPAGELDVGVPHPRDCLADPSTWPGDAAKPGQLQAERRADGHVEVRNPGGRVLTVSTWTMPEPKGVLVLVDEEAGR